MKFDKRLSQFKLVTIVCIYYICLKRLKVSYTPTKASPMGLDSYSVI